MKGYIDGQYVFEGTEVFNQFVFYRRDRNLIQDSEKEIACKMYRIYIISEYLNGNSAMTNIDNIEFDKTDDVKFIRLTTNESIVPIKHKFSSKKIPKSLIKSLFRSKAKLSNDNNNK